MAQFSMLFTTLRVRQEITFLSAQESPNMKVVENCTVSNIVNCYGFLSLPTVKNVFLI